MRWIWIDKFVDFVPGESATTVKNVSLAEDYLHDQGAAFPIVPHSLIVEGVAQTGGILVGDARHFSEKVILAKIGRAVFHRLTRPGDTLQFHTKIERLSEHGASIIGEVRCISDAQSPLVAAIELMFSHIDKNLAGTAFPEHNFVFTEQFTDLLKMYKLNAAIRI